MNSHDNKQPVQHRPASDHLAARRIQHTVQSDAGSSGLQEAAYSSPQVQQFKAYQSMANDSLQARQLRSMQAMANKSVQKKSQAPGSFFALKSQPVQRVISLETLENKLGTHPAYGGTIDTDTPWATANAVGAAWVGEGARETFYGASGWPSLTSARRQYRPPMLKKGGQKSGEVQANYEAKGEKDADFTFNAHVTINDLNSESLAPHKKKALDDYKAKREAGKKGDGSGGAGSAGAGVVETK